MDSYVALNESIEPFLGYLCLDYSYPLYSDLQGHRPQKHFGKKNYKQIIKKNNILKILISMGGIQELER